jgi:hypothetical protein
LKPRNTTKYTDKEKKNTVEEEDRIQNSESLYWSVSFILIGDGGQIPDFAEVVGDLPAPQN